MNNFIILEASAGSGKTHKLIETILFTELIYDKPYFDNIIFCSTSEALDKNSKFVIIKDLDRYGLVIDFTGNLISFVSSGLDFGKFIDKLIDSHKHEFFEVEL